MRRKQNKMTNYSEYEHLFEEEGQDLYELKEFEKEDLLSKGIDGMIKFFESLKWELEELKLTEPENYDQILTKNLAHIIDYSESKTFDNFLIFLNKINESYSEINNLLHYSQMELIKNELKEISSNLSESKIIDELKKRKSRFISGFLINFQENEFLIKAFIDPKCPENKMNDVYNEIESRLLDIFDHFEITCFDYEIIVDNINGTDPNEFELKI